MPRLTSQGERGERGAVSANVPWKVSSFERCQRSRRRCISLAALEDTEEEGYCGYRIPRRAFFVAPFAGCHSAVISDEHRCSGLLPCWSRAKRSRVHGCTIVSGSVVTTWSPQSGRDVRLNLETAIGEN
ncbi:hypothetical protein EAG_12327 [Camponotus floridanus]|uniref:Uncharacterized protein n=1 Tax=Camponotus floridanus TaxID=104421 RepID=E2B0D2_CAMFO|nr:hypothetical protein EAG_12327 [Camponotus floridanus]